MILSAFSFSSFSFSSSLLTSSVTAAAVARVQPWRSRPSETRKKERRRLARCGQIPILMMHWPLCGQTSDSYDRERERESSCAGSAQTTKSRFDCVRVEFEETESPKSWVREREREYSEKVFCWVQLYIWIDFFTHKVTNSPSRTVKMTLKLLYAGKVIHWTAQRQTVVSDVRTHTPKLSGKIESNQMHNWSVTELTQVQLEVEVWWHSSLSFSLASLPVSICACEVCVCLPFIESSLSLCSSFLFSLSSSLSHSHCSFSSNNPFVESKFANLLAKAVSERLWKWRERGARNESSSEGRK